MAFNKSKALESALKFLNQGKVAQAIGEYQQILRHDPKDQATLMTVGDLFARQGDMTQAIEYFERLAQVYLSDGFNSKAIAIYKKIAKLAPAEMAPLERLADLYVQQGVLSEARPLFIQIAEAHLKANRSVKAVEVLHRLLEVEPENPRVQMRLAELYNVMGQKKEAAQTYLSYAQRLFERNENEEAQKLIDRALEVDATNPTAILLKGRILATLKKNDQAIKVLETHPEANAGAEVTDLIIDLELESGHPAKAVDRARKQLTRGHAHFVQLHKVTDAMIEAGQMVDVLPLLRELRNPMIEAGEQDKFLKSLTTATERAPGEMEGLEMLVDFCRHTSDPFRLSAALGQLADAYADTGNFLRAEELLQELVDRNKNDERLVERLNQLRARAGGGGSAPPQPEPIDVASPPSMPQSMPESFVSVSAPSVEAEPAVQNDEAPPAPAILEEELDEETQRYVAQALTDVDLFSSYGLTQKATHLLENDLQRAPRHTPTLERLLDLYLGGGNERRTAETASLLEQIHRERNDTVNADRFAELRQRFQKVAGISHEDMPTAPPAVVSTPAAAPAAEAQASIQAAPEIEVPVEAPLGAIPRPVVKPSTAEFEIALTPPEPEQAAEPSPTASPAADVAPEAETVAAAEEVDLSDEWEAMAQEVAQSTAPESQEVANAPEPEPAPEPIAANEPEAEPEPEQVEAEAFVIDASEAEPEPEPEPVPEAVVMQDAASEPAIEPSIELIEEPVAASPVPDAAEAINGDFELELAPEPSHSQKSGPLSTEDLISELVAEIDGMDAPSTSAASEREPIAPPEPVAPAPVAVASARPQAKAAPPPPPPPVAQEPVPEVTAESLNQLAEVFQEFRTELGEMGDEDEDLETHYNLGIAYREMGLLDEAIGEFQKVAKAIQKGKPFAYEMNCSTLLALSFMDKGEPKIASVWYRRALETPGLEQESVLALRYDLGLALESAGESKGALDSFQQVYAMNIDYRDVADRISLLQKQESHV
jgi:tetratricopeptide (TPR) repeat protein